VLIGVLFIAIIVAIAGLAFDSGAKASDENRKGPPQGWY
jgi:hypothetical protein